MLEKENVFYLEKESQWERQYIIERMEDGRFALLARRPEVCGSSPAARTAGPLAEIVEKWLDAVRYQVKESTYVKYWNLAHSYIIPELGAAEWHALNRETVEKFCSKMLSSGGKGQRGLSARTVSDVMCVLRQIFRYASDRGIDIPFNISSITVKKEQKEMKILTAKEQNKLYRHLRRNGSDRNLGILICMFAGLRLGEICALKWEDISFSEQTIYVHQTMQRIQTKDDSERKTKIIITSPKSGNSVRKIPIPGELMKILFSYRENRKGYVLTGRPDAFVEPRTMERHFEKILQQAGIERVNFHALRHTFATRCVEMDFDIKCLSEILGHANVNITLNRYVHPTMELKRSNMQKLSALLAVNGWAEPLS